MTNPLAGLTTSADVQQETDSVGGGYKPLASAVYELTVKLAYLNIAQSGAMALNYVFVTDNNEELRGSFWMTSGTAKGGKNYYEKDGKKFYLPGFNAANALSLLTVGKEIGEVDLVEKVINLYNYDAKKEVPTQVKMFDALLGQKVKAGVLKQLEDKNVKDATGNYVPSGETRETNEVDKIFRASDGLTVPEIKGGITSPEFLAKWADKWTGQVKDKTSGTAPKAGTPAVGAAGSAPAKPLFG